MFCAFVDALINVLAHIICGFSAEKEKLSYLVSRYVQILAATGDTINTAPQRNF